MSAELWVVLKSENSWFVVGKVGADWILGLAHPRGRVYCKGIYYSFILWHERESSLPRVIFYIAELLWLFDRSLTYYFPHSFHLSLVSLANIIQLHLHLKEFSNCWRPSHFKGHETVGVVAAIGKDVKDFKIGERVCADNSELCKECFYCRRGQLLLCEKFEAHGVTSK